MKRRKDVRKEIQCRFGAWHVAQMKSLPRVSTYGTSPDEKSSQGGHPRREQIQEAKSEAYGPAVRLEQKINEKQATLAMGGYNVRGRGAIEAFFTKRIIATLLICTRPGLSENEIWSAKELFSGASRLCRNSEKLRHCVASPKSTFSETAILCRTTRCGNCVALCCAPQCRNSFG